MKAKAMAHPNIAVVKYWGKADDELRLPMNSSVSITLDKLWTKTEVEFDERLEQDEIKLVGGEFSDKEKKRIVKHLDRVREMVKIELKAKVRTESNFKKASGMASSASGFAALSLAASRAVGLDLKEKDLSVLARLGSGSACRSIHGGIVVWHKGDESQSSFAERLEYEKDWNLKVLLVEVDQEGEKKVKSTEAMARVKTSPYFNQALKEAEENKDKIIKALKQGDWEAFGRIVELECYRLKKLTETSKPGIVYWQEATYQVAEKAKELREDGLLSYVTTDAGPHIHVICQKKDTGRLKSELEQIKGVKEIIECGVGVGATLV